MPGSGAPGLPPGVKGKPGIAGFIIGALLVVVGLGMAAHGFGGNSGGTTTTGGVADQPSHPTDGSLVQVTLQAGQTTGIWFSSASTEGASCGLADPSGTPMDFDNTVTPQVVAGYTLKATFQTTTSGQYSVECQTTGAALTYKVGWTGTTVSSSDAPVEVGQIVGTLAAIGGGIALLIVTGVRRSKWTSQHNALAGAAGYYGAANYGPVGAQQAYQPAGYQSGPPQPSYGPQQSAPPQPSPYGLTPAGQSTPTYSSPSFDTSSYSPSSYPGPAQPSFGEMPGQQPNQGSSSFGPVGQPPSFPGPANQPPAYPGPANQPPSYAGPANQPPAFPGPAGQPPSYPGSAGQAPAFQPPSYPGSNGQSF